MIENNKDAEILSQAEKKEYLVSLVMLFAGLSMMIASESTQRNLDLYYSQVKVVGEALANFTLGQMGDMGGPIFMGGLGALFDKIFAHVGVEVEDMENLWFFIFINAASLYGIFSEVLSYYGDNSGCGDPTQMCRGEFSDVFVMSVPIITTFLYLLRQKMSSKE